MKSSVHKIIFILIGFILPPMVLLLQACSSGNSDSNAVSHSLKDEDISRAVRTELMIAPNISPDSLKINVVNGIVTLSGTTDNILTKKRAAKIAESVTGVLEVRNKIKVIKTVRNDADIKDDIITAIDNNPATDAFQVSTKVDNGNVTLSGIVQSWQEKELCGRIAETVKGVLDVVNNIKINYTAFRSDEDIMADILSRLKWDIYVNQQYINVAVDNGNVTLSGTVASAAEREWAYDDAWVNGVKSVNDNNLKVIWWQNSLPATNRENIILRDKEIQAALEQAYILDPEIISDRVHIKVNNGIVTLSGTVSNLQAKNAAEEDAKRTIGVFGIKNDLKVEPETIPENVKIEDGVSRAIKRNPYLDKLKIDVDVQNGVVYLTGDVNNSYEKDVAAKMASSVKGVTAVQNDITFREPEVETKDDSEIKANIKKQLFWNPITNSQKIHIKVKDGNALLTGFVDTRLEKFEAGIEAIQGGASEVDNELGVISGPQIVNQ